MSVTPPVGEDLEAIKTLLDAFVKAFNAGNAEAAAATYTEKAVVVDEEGERTEDDAAAIHDRYTAASQGAVNTCSTPLGITEVGTRLRLPSNSRTPRCAQRLSASLRLAHGRLP